MPDHIGVVVSTYKAPAALDRALLALSLQTDQRFEVLVADDGSGPETAEVLNRRRALGITIQHVWHEDRGFRKCEILNRAIQASTGDYLVFIDGDCIPRPDFIAAHRREAEPGCFLSGSYNNLPESMGPALTEDAIRSGDAFRYGWLRQHGMPRTRKAWRLTRWPLVAEVLNSVTTTKANWNGCNSSAWKADLERAGGFDQRMHYGGEDRELGYRLENAGLMGKQVRFKAICLHVDHPRDYVDSDAMQRNLAIRQVTRRMRLTTTPHGIRKAA